MPTQQIVISPARDCGTSRSVDFAERWARLEESIGALRALWRAGAPPFVGRFYSTAGISLDPHPVRTQGPAIWLDSWGSETGLRRTAPLADGWLASAYNTTPTLFAAGWSQLQDLLPSHGKNPGSFPNALATMWLYITDNPHEADRVMRERIDLWVPRTPSMGRELDFDLQRLMRRASGGGPRVPVPGVLSRPPADPALLSQGGRPRDRGGHTFAMR
jgi:alkanesulfonate monooxygenase SsuD/methylene tetrahydromethanopterin reductase-like flavin-dependent oxidoreductase (luciferase family)